MPNLTQIRPRGSFWANRWTITHLAFLFIHTVSQKLPSLAAGATAYPIQSYKLSVLMYSCLNGAAPRYLTELATPVGGTARRRRLRWASSTDLVVPLHVPHVDQKSAIARSPLLAREHGTVYLLLSAHLPHTTPSKKSLNLTFLDYPSHCDMCILTMYSALVVVYTAYCALQIVRLTLHYTSFFLC